MNDSPTLLLFFVTSIAVWVGFITVIVIIVKGRNRENNRSRAYSAELGHAAHGDDAER